MNKIKVSLVITVHNSEQYLEECLKSACEQSLKEIEIICVDGGSVDSSPQIIEKYQKEDSRIVVINDKNTSYGHKVNVGFEAARGEYVAVLESDDKIMPQMLETLYEATRQQKVDYVDCDHNNFFTVKGHEFYFEIPKYQDKSLYEKVIKNQECLHKMPYITNFWTGIYRKAFLEEQNIKFHESPGASYQDISFRFLTEALAETSYHTSEKLHYYRVDNEGSSVKDMSKIAVVMKELEFLKKELQKRDITNADIWNSYYQWKYIEYEWNLLRLTESARSQFYQLYKEELMNDKDMIARNAEHYFEKVLKTPDSYMEEIQIRGRERNAYQPRVIKMIEKVMEKPTVIFGSGRRGERILKILKPIRNQILCWADNNQEVWNTEKEGIVVLSPEEAVKRYPNALYLVANAYHADEMVKQLENAGIPREHIHVGLR